MTLPPREKFSLLGSLSDGSNTPHYAFAVQQVLAMVGVQRFGPIVFFAAAFVLVVPLAWLSWTFVEHPSLRLARPLSQETAGSGHVATAPVVKLLLP